MIVRTPFFISPAYWVPKMTISLRPKCNETEVLEVIPFVYLLAGKLPTMGLAKKMIGEAKIHTSVVDNVIGLSESSQLLASGADEHVIHEQSMVSTLAHNSDLDGVLGIPSSISVNNVQLITSVQVILQCYSQYLGSCSSFF